MEEVDNYLEKIRNWKTESTLLREICLESGLEEDFKWMHPCYTYHGKNIVLIHGFKDYCALLFHKGVLMSDSEKLLVQQTENVQSARQLRFTSIEEIHKQRSLLKTYIFEAIAIEKAGLRVEKKETSEYPLPEELQLVFAENPELEKAFSNLTPGRQRGYLLYFSQAKQAKTRTARIQQAAPNIFNGKGYNDR